MSASRTVVTDWRVRDEQTLPDLAPGEDYERVIAPQKFVVLHQILVWGPSLVGLGIGGVRDVPFELENADTGVRRYRLRGLTDEALKNSFAKNGGAAAVGDHALAIAPGLEVRLLLRNEGAVPVKPRAAIVVQEES